MLGGFPPETPPAVRRQVLAVLGVALLAVSTSAVIVRYLDGVDPIVIAAWRTTFSALLLLPVARLVPRRDAVRVALAGAALAAHFAVWFASLQLTTVLRSTVLVTLAPVWVGLSEWLLPGPSPSRRFWAGLGVGLAGVVAMSSAGEAGGGSLQGDALALVAGQLGAAYFLLGRSVRQRVGIGPYAFWVAAVAAMLLMPVALAGEAPLTGFAPGTWALLLATAVGPQLLGHNGFNYTLRWLPAATVSAVILLEPVGATLLAIPALGEVPSLGAALAGTVVVAGVLYAVGGAKDS